MEWISVYEDNVESNVPRYTDLLFCTANNEVYFGSCQGLEKLSKCIWAIPNSLLDFDTDPSTSDDLRVTHWMLLPEPPTKKAKGK